MDASNKCGYCDISSGTFIKHHKSNQSDNLYLFITYSLWMSEDLIEFIEMSLSRSERPGFTHNYKYYAVVIIIIIIIYSSNNIVHVHI